MIQFSNKKIPKHFKYFKITLPLFQNQLGYPGSPITDKTL